MHATLQPPAIVTRRLDEPPFSVECRELPWFSFVAPELGQETWVTSYEYPGPRFWQRRRSQVQRRARVHGIECFEARQQCFDAQGTLQDESATFARLDRGYVRTYAYLHAEGDSVHLTTWKDDRFNEDWSYDPGAPVHLADVGRWHTLDEQHVAEVKQAAAPPAVSPNGAGLWEVRLGGAVHRCLRILEPGPHSPEGILVEVFVDEAGHIVLARRYNGVRWAYSSGRYRVDGRPAEWTEILPDAPRLYLDDVCYVLWDFSIPDRAL